MNYDDFVARFGEPVQTQDGTILFETYAQDYKRVRATDPKCVWTLVEEDGKLYLAPGFHFVNRLNYVIAQSHARTKMSLSGFLTVMIDFNKVQLLSI